LSSGSGPNQRFPNGNSSEAEWLLRQCDTSKSIFGQVIIHTLQTGFEGRGCDAFR